MSYQAPKLKRSSKGHKASNVKSHAEKAWTNAAGLGQARHNYITSFMRITPS